MSDTMPRAGDCDYHERLQQWVDTCDALADAFEAQTPAFERTRFLKDCGYPVVSPPPGV
jgi:hypothetical protein